MPAQPQSVFSSLHPAIAFAFFAFAIALGMFVRHPAFQAVAVACSAACYLSIRGRAGGGAVVAMVPLFAALAVLNPLFNPMGDTVLFTYAGGRAYTWEAFAFGMSTGAMFTSMLLWFFSYSVVMTSDKFSYLFGGVAPALTLVLTMALRLIPTYQRRMSQLATARSCVGKGLGADGGGLLARVAAAGTLVSALATWAFEGAVTTSDSMRSRGYGSGPRTQFPSYRFDARDRALLAAMMLLAAVVLGCVLAGAADVAYLPAIVIPEFGPLAAAGLASYAAFLALPLIVNAKEALAWRISLSRI